MDAGVFTAVTADDTAPRERVRLDKWLWAARFYRTRTLAVQAIEAGQVRVDDERSKPAHPVRPGARISVRKSGLVLEVLVCGLSDRRGGAKDAALLYTETAQSAAARERFVAERAATAQQRPRFPGRPTKRERRKLEDFLAEP
jgi:ribosome-associated heat shock protein Hsp15